MIQGVALISLLGFAAGLYLLGKHNKQAGIIEILLALSCPIITILFGSLQDDRVFGGTKLEFFIHSAVVDGDIWPWILCVLLIVEIIFIVKAVFVLKKAK